jgi:hypothetical protein
MGDRRQNRANPSNRPILAIGPDDFADCPECHLRLRDLGTLRTDADGELHVGECPAHGQWRYLVEQEPAACPGCGDRDHVYTRAADWRLVNGERWELVETTGEYRFDCGECDNETDQLENAPPFPALVSGDGGQFWRAGLETRNFDFEAFGATEDAARAALVATLTAHGKQCGLKPGWWDIMGEFRVEALALGTGYRDREQLDGGAQ